VATTNSVQKCSILPLTDILANVNVVKDLGILVDSRLIFECHINKIVARASARVNLITNVFFSKDTANMTRLFTAYMRPLLEYASCVWSPCSIKDVKCVLKIECN